MSKIRATAWDVEGSAGLEAGTACLHSRMAPHSGSWEEHVCPRKVGTAPRRTP